MKNQYVLGFAFNNDRSKVLLITKKRPLWQAGLYNGIGGKIESFDLSPAHALTREFKEEAGIQTSENQWKEYATVESDIFHVTCFWTILDNFDSYQSITDEEISDVSITYLFNSQFNNCLSNLSWLICMALEKNDNTIYSKVMYN